MERVAGVLERLSRADVDDPHRLVKEAKQITDMLGDTRVGCSYDKERRGEEVGNPGTLPEELRAHPCSDGERDTAKAIDNRRYHFIDRARRHGTADDDAVPTGRWRCHDGQRSYDVVHSPPDVEQIRAAACRRGGSNTNEGHVGPVQGFGARGSGVQRAVGHCLGDQPIQTWFRHGATAGADLINLGSIDVNSPDVVPARG